MFTRPGRCHCVVDILATKIGGKTWANPQMLIRIPRMGPPVERRSSVASKKWLNSMVYDRYNINMIYNYSIHGCFHGVYQPTYNWGAPSSVMNGFHDLLLGRWNHRSSFKCWQSNVINQPYLPSGYVKIAIENGHRNSEFSH